MTIAAEQCREWIEAEFPGVRVSRQSCRLTSGGLPSQHSAYGTGTSTPRDSNALDIFGPEELDRDAERAFVDVIVQALEAYRDQWSIRLLLWNVPAHYGHAHVDFYPYITYPAKWCADWQKTPVWKRSDGSSLSSRDPEPEAGRFNGPTAAPPLDPITPEWEDEMDTPTWAATLRRRDVARAVTAGSITADEATYWAGPRFFDPAAGETAAPTDPNNPEWEDYRRAITVRRV